MRRIGLLGGMSWESSIEYERMINEQVRARLGGVHSADLVIRSYDFADIESLQAAGDWEAAGELLTTDALLLEQAGAEVIALCTNTMHLVAERIESSVTAEFVHLADATADRISGAGVGSVALLGTRYTMEQDVYRSRLEGRGIQVVVPPEPDRTVVHEVIYDELVRGVIDPTSRRRYVEIVERLVDVGVEGVVAGCTEIELLLGDDDVSVPLFRTMAIHVDAIVAAALAR